MTKKRSAQPFNRHHEIRYGLRVHSRDAKGKVTGVRCLFCFSFGRQMRDKSSTNRKTNRCVSVPHIYKSFRPDYYLKHLRNHHIEKWLEYEQADDEQKRQFFETNTPFANRLESHFGKAATAIFKIHSDIVDKIILNYFVDSSSSELHALKELKQTDTDTFELTVNNMTHFEMSTKHVSNGLSFRQVALVSQSTRLVVGAADLRGMTESVIRTCVRSAVAINLQKLRYLLSAKPCWAFSIAFDTATNAGDDYLDLRVRFFASGKLQNYHVLAVPMTDRHTGEVMFDIVKTVLHALVGPSWKEKLLSAATDGASNMTGRFQGAVTRIENECCPGFFRIWCLAHQLDLLIQDLFKQLLSESFYNPLISFISFLRRQSTLINSMGSKCPAVCSTRWHSLGSAVNWLISNRDEVMQYAQLKQHPSLPSTTWWLMAEAVKHFMHDVDICFKSIQGRSMLINEQMSRIDSLCYSIYQAINVTGPLQGADLLINAADDAVIHSYSDDSGLFVIHRHRVMEHLENCGSAPEEDLNRLNQEEQDQVLKLVCNLHVEAIRKLKALRATRTATNAPSNASYPPILPSELSKLKPKEFNNILRSQKGRILSTFKSDMLVKIEDDFKQFKTLIQSNTSSQQALKVSAHTIAGQCSLFEEAWDFFKVRFPRLHNFCGGLSSVFPGTATVESDFSNLQWEKNPSRSNLTDLSLEGILQCKQHSKLASVFHCKNLK